jgi:hypothetical protein
MQREASKGREEEGEKGQGDDCSIAKFSRDRSQFIYAVSLEDKSYNSLQIYVSTRRRREKPSDNVFDSIFAFLIPGTETSWVRGGGEKHKTYDSDCDSVIKLEKGKTAPSIKVKKKSKRRTRSET